VTGNPPLVGRTVLLVGMSPEMRVGSGPLAEGLAQVLSGTGARVRFVSYVHSGSLRLKRHNGEGVTLVLPASGGRLAKGLRLLWFFFWHTCRAGVSADVVFYTGGTILLYIPVALASAICGKPSVFYYLDIEVEPVPEILRRYFLRHSSCVIGVSRHLADRARTEGAMYIAYIPPFVDTQLFSPPSEDARRNSRARLGIGPDELVIGYAGSLSETEGVSVLVRAIKSLASRMPNVRLLILGSKAVIRRDDVADTIKKAQLEERVVLVPPVPHKEVPQVLAACDILCSPKIDHPVNRATLAIKSVEYMSMGLPIVATAVGEIAEVIRHGYDGYLARPSDPEDLALTLEQVGSNPIDARDAGDRGRETAIALFGHQSIAQTLVDAILHAARAKG